MVQRFYIAHDEKISIRGLAFVVTVFYACALEEKWLVFLVLFNIIYKFQ